MNLRGFMRTKKGDKEKLRVKILARALAYFKKNGRSGSAAEDIMEHAGLTKGALYSHFKSKDDLFVNAVAFDLTNLTTAMKEIFKTHGQKTFDLIIDEYLSLTNLKDVSQSCVFSSLSSDMQRCKPSQRSLFEPMFDEMFLIYADGLKPFFPTENNDQLMMRAYNLHCGLVGTLTMARTLKDSEKAQKILEAGKLNLKQSIYQTKTN